MKDIEKILEYWTRSAEIDYEVMHSLYDKKYYSWSLFIGHLVIEKLSKAYYTKVRKKDAPKIHDIRRIFELAGYDVPNNLIAKLDAITKFNINGRYSSYKNDFYKKCSKDFADKWVNEIKEIRKWILMKL